MKNKLGKIGVVVTLLFLTFVPIWFINRQPELPVTPTKVGYWWPLQSVDTVKYSRDLARLKSNDETFKRVIDSQVVNIARTGATHVAIGTPYDPEFVPFLKEWVKVARKHKLKVWFRGNFSGWEGWFNYPKIGRTEHLKMLSDFILD